jgi:hypothetical protein
MPRQVPGFWLVVALLAAAAPAAAQTLDGWGSFKFGMSPDQARAVPGTSFGRYSSKNILNLNSGAMASKKPALVNGVPYKFDLLFNAFETLNRISLNNEKTTGRAECETRFLTLLSNMEKSYGKFLPVYPRQKKNDQNQLPIAVDWKNSGASGYQLATVYMAEETAYVWNARFVLNNRYVDAVAAWSAAQQDSQAVCLTDLEFKG